MEDTKVPRGWVFAAVEDVISSHGIFTDGDWVETKDQDPNGDVRLIQLADIGDGSFLDKSSRFLTKSKAYELNCTFLNKGDLLVARMPDPLGRCCIFPLDGDEKFITVVDVCTVRPGSSSITPKYLMFAINSPRTRMAIEALKSGSTRKRISRRNFASVQIPLAPRNEQRRIVAKIEELFSELDKGVESLETARAQLEVYRQAVLKHAFEGKLTTQWREENQDKIETAEQLLDRIGQEREAEYQRRLEEWSFSLRKWEQNEKKGKKPAKPKKNKKLQSFNSEELEKLPDIDSASWKWTKVDEICSYSQYSIKAGPFGSALKKQFYVPDGYKVYGQEQVISGDPNFGDYFVDAAKYEELSTCKVAPRDVLVSLVGTVGKVLVLPDDCSEGVINPRLVKISLNLKYYRPNFFKYYFESAFVRSLCRTLATGTTMDVLNLGIIRNLPFPLCSIPEQDKLMREIESKLSVIDQIENEIEAESIRAEALRQSILKKAFSGELVEQDPNDEPAAALLERIKAKKASRKPRAKTRQRKVANA